MRLDFRGLAWIDGAFRQGAVIEIDGGAITDIQHGETHSGETDELLLLPGLVDVHVHGGNGADFMDGSFEAAQTVARFHLRHGTTALAATTLSAGSDRITKTVRAVRTAVAAEDTAGAEIVGIHFEGPYINRIFAGAQDRGSIRGADHHEVDAWLAAAGDLAVMMTVAPEIPHVNELIRRYAKRITFSIGHSDATFAQCVAAVEMGARHFTHLFNAMRPMHHREPGAIGAALISPETTAELIADGHHIHPAVLRTFARLLHDRAILVTDAMRACGMPDGTYKLYEHEVMVSEGTARLADGTLAGSVLTMIDAVRNMVELAGLPLTQVIPLATTHPAARLGVGRRKGRIAVGCDADLLMIDQHFEIQRLWRSGAEL